MAFHWRAVDGQLIVVYLPSSTKNKIAKTKQKKRCQSLTPSDKSFLDFAWASTITSTHHLPSYKHNTSTSPTHHMYTSTITPHEQHQNMTSMFLTTHHIFDPTDVQHFTSCKLLNVTVAIIADKHQILPLFTFCLINSI